MRFLILILLFCLPFCIVSCNKSRVHEHEDWQKIYASKGIQNACIIIRDHNHESIHYYNMERCTRRFLPASSFKIFSSLTGLETAVAPDEQLVIKWDGKPRRATWDKDMNMREAFKVSNVAYYQELVRRVGRAQMQHWLDTVKYGNQKMDGAVDMFWLNDTLQISADEQLGFVKRLYFDELPFSERSQRIVRSMMLQEETPDYKLYYKTGTGEVNDSMIYWIVGFAEKIEHFKEHEESMNKSDVRNYPYFFAQNFSVGAGDTLKDYASIRLEALKAVLASEGVLKLK